MLTIAMLITLVSTEIVFPIFGTRRREAYYMNHKNKQKEEEAFAAGVAVGSAHHSNEEEYQEYYPEEEYSEVQTQAVRKNDGKAFAAGVAAGRTRQSNENEEESNNNSSEVQTQALSDDTDITNEYENFDLALDQDQMTSPESYDFLTENYADDANVLVQSMGFEGGNLNQEEKDLLKAKVLEKLKARRNGTNNVITQSITSLENNDQLTNTPFEDEDLLLSEIDEPVEALDTEELSDDLTSATLPSDITLAQPSAPTSTDLSMAKEILPVDTPSLPSEVVLSETDLPTNTDVSIVEATLPVDNSLTDTMIHTDQGNTAFNTLPSDEPTNQNEVVTQAVDSEGQIEENAVAASQITEQALTEEKQAVKTEAAPVTQPTPVEESVAPVSAQPEQVKIVKVYPVYNAIYAIVSGVKTAAFDMINYVYSLFTNKADTGKDGSVKIQKQEFYE